MNAVAVPAGPMSPESLQAHAIELLARDGWTRRRLLEHQQRRLRDLLRYAVEHSPYYREALGPDAAGAELASLPTLAKELLMEQFDRIVTDPRARISELEPFLSNTGPDPAASELRVFGTSGTTGTPGVFVYSQSEFAHWAAVFLRVFARLGVTGATRLVGIGAPSALHLSRQTVAALQAGRGDAPRLSVVTPIEEMVSQLNAYRPEAIGSYASVLAALAEEQLRGRLEIAPRIVVSTSEVLTDDAAARIAEAWVTPVDMYASTEVGVIASGSLDHVGLHVCEEAIVEVVDEQGRPVPAGTLGGKLLLTNLVNRVQPLIRYELLDAVVLADDPDPSGRPYDRIMRIDGRSDELLRLPGAEGGEVVVHPYRLRAPFVRLLDVQQYQVVLRADGLVVRVVVRDSAPRDLPDVVRAALEESVAAAGATVPVRVEVVDRIEREPGTGAKLKLVRSEVPKRA